MSRQDELRDRMGSDWWSVNQVAGAWRIPVSSIRMAFAAAGPKELERRSCELTGRTLYRWRDHG